MHYFLNFKRLSTPFLFLAILLNINPKLSEVRANNKIIPANDKDLNLYENMGVSYLCSTSENGTDSEFEKSLVVATNLPNFSGFNSFRFSSKALTINLNSAFLSSSTNKIDS